MNDAIQVTDIEQARALPEIQGRYFDEEKKIIQDGPDRGMTVVTRKVRPFVPVPISPEQILYFCDSDGRSMEVVYTEAGPAKCGAFPP